MKLQDIIPAWIIEVILWLAVLTGACGFFGVLVQMLGIWR